MVGYTAAAVNRIGSQLSEFRGQQQVRTRPVDNVRQRAPVPTYNGAKIIGVGGKSTNISGESVIYGQRSIQLDLGRELELKLAPTPAELSPRIGAVGL